MKTLLPALSFLLLAAPLSGQTAAPDRTEVLLQRLADAPGPPGAEEPVRALMVPEMKQFATQPIRYDGIGSVIAEQGQKAGKPGPRIMIDAHMDELGGMVRRVTPNGYLSMQMLGGWLDQALVDQRWIILGSKGPVHAVTGIRDIHVLPAEDRSKVFPRDSVFLDMGAKDAAQVAALGVSVGDPVVPDSPFLHLTGTDNYLGKAWDDRIGCAVLLEAMRRTAGMAHPNTLVYVATVQEEVGLRGGRTAAQTVKPDIGIALEGGITGDQPGARPEESQVRLGGGPGMFLYDSSTIANRKMVAFTRQMAAEAHTPLQADLVQGYGDDSAEMQMTNGGTPTINLVVPVRYTHSHNGIVNRGDFDRTVDLVVAMLMHLDQARVNDLRDFTPQP